MKRDHEGVYNKPAFVKIAEANKKIRTMNIAVDSKVHSVPTADKKTLDGEAGGRTAIAEAFKPPIWRFPLLENGEVPRRELFCFGVLTLTMPAASNA